MINTKQQISLSQSKSKKQDKIILHIDFNSFFASVEQQANPFLRDKPIAVAGKGKSPSTTNNLQDKNRLHRTIITTASQEAKKMGVKTAMSSIKALEICPELIIVPGDPRKYSQITKRFLEILHKYADSVEQFSTDEAFADITTIAQDYMGATFIAQMIRNDIKTYCGEFCTASIGIAPNKLVAKLAGESMKPSGITIVSPQNMNDFLESRPLEAFCGIGPRIIKKLEKMGASTVRTLKLLSHDELIKEFKSYGTFLFFAVRGIGDHSINPEKSPAKSIGHSYTFSHNLLSEIELKHNLLALCDKVAYRLRKNNLQTRLISIYARFPNMKGKGQQIQISEFINDGLAIFEYAWPLLKKSIPPHIPVRLLGITASELSTSQQIQSLLPKKEKMRKITSKLDQLHEKYGKNIWKRAATLNTLFAYRTSGWHYDHQLEQKRS